MLVLVLAVAAGAAAASQAAGGQSQADRLRAIETARLQALVDGDTAAAGRSIAPDYQLINPAGLALGRDDLLGAVQAGVLDFRVNEPIGPIAVRVAGDAATLRYKTSFDVVAGGVHVTHDGWTTELYERRDGHWQVVWGQSTAIPNDTGLFLQSIMPVG
jgi:hypothetical protein